MTIHAQAAMASKQSLNPFHYEPAALGPNDIEIAITHCGICHSDIHLIDNDWGVSSYPLVPGHEIIGTIVDAGGDAKHLKQGQRVGVGWQRSSCLVCKQCVKGDENLCPENRAMCVGNHGGFADRIRVREPGRSQESRRLSRPQRRPLPSARCRQRRKSEASDNPLSLDPAPKVHIITTDRSRGSLRGRLRFLSGGKPLEPVRIIPAKGCGAKSTSSGVA